MIEAIILHAMEVRYGANRILVLVIQSCYSIVKVTIRSKAIDFLYEQAKVKQAIELVRKGIMLDADANFSCIYVIIKKKGKVKKLMPVPCDISLIKNIKKQ